MERRDFNNTWNRKAIDIVKDMTLEQRLLFCIQYEEFKKVLDFVTNDDALANFLDTKRCDGDYFDDHWMHE
jgi:hypothetical protein